MAAQQPLWCWLPWNLDHVDCQNPVPADERCEPACPDLKCCKGLLYLTKKLTLPLTSGDLWTGGMETSVTTLRWAIIFLMYHPHIQKRLHDEIDQVLGDSRATYSCRNQKSFTSVNSQSVPRHSALT
ncbi:unnamed protein product, partial [Mesorhabditis belari]|uniref:Cytochrome P450 n=1 Tax=Mesorhabditis belari TaxID=2138241 RepID=A0AAF3J3Q2_9BILA